MYIRSDNMGAKLLHMHRMNSEQVKEVMQRLSSGKRINKASDDAAGLAISTRFTSQINRKQKSIQNIKQAQDLLNVGDSTLGSVQE